MPSSVELIITEVRKGSRFLGEDPLRPSVLGEQGCESGPESLTYCYARNGATLVALGEVFSSLSATACCAERVFKRSIEPFTFCYDFLSELSC